MRVMVIVKANEESESGATPNEKMLSDMGKFNEELMKRRQKSENTNNVCANRSKSRQRRE